MSIIDEQKIKIRQQAHNCCEYCRVEGENRASKYQVDHIIALKHDGTDDDDNLCLACIQCNQYS